MLSTGLVGDNIINGCSTYIWWGHLVALRQPCHPRLGDSSASLTDRSSAATSAIVYVRSWPDSILERISVASCTSSASSRALSARLLGSASMSTTVSLPSARSRSLMPP